MAYQKPTTTARGNATTKPTPTPTPAPMKNPPVTGDFTRPLGKGSRYGEGQYAGSSSIPPGTATRMDGIDTSPPDGDPVLDAVRAGKKDMVSADQVRRVGPNVPVHPAMKK